MKVYLLQRGNKCKELTSLDHKQELLQLWGGANGHLESEIMSSTYACIAEDLSPVCIQREQCARDDSYVTYYVGML
jgi:hypothetical protein